MSFHIPLFFFFLSYAFSFSIFLSPSISAFANLTLHLLYCIYCYRPFIEHPLNSVCKLSKIPPSPVLILDVCLSLSVSLSGKQSLRLSINVLSFDFFFLSVYLSVWHVGSCLSAPGLLSAKCWFLFFCQFTCLSKLLRLDMSTYLWVSASAGWLYQK